MWFYVRAGEMLSTQARQGAATRHEWGGIDGWRVREQLGVRASCLRMFDEAMEMTEKHAHVRISSAGPLAAADGRRTCTCTRGGNYSRNHAIGKRDMTLLRIAACPQRITTFQRPTTNRLSADLQEQIYFLCLVQFCIELLQTRLPLLSLVGVSLRLDCSGRPSQRRCSSGLTPRRLILRRCWRSSRVTIAIVG